MNKIQQRRIQIRQNSVQICHIQSDKNRSGGWMMFLVNHGHGETNNRLRI